MFFDIATSADELQSELRDSHEADGAPQLSEDFLNAVIARKMREAGFAPSTSELDDQEERETRERILRESEIVLHPEKKRERQDVVAYDVEGDSETEERSTDRGDGSCDHWKLHRKRTLKARLETKGSQGDSAEFQTAGRSRLIYAGDRRCRLEVVRDAHDDQNTPRVEEFGESMPDGSESFTKRSCYQRNLTLKGRVVLDLSEAEIDALPSLLDKDTEEEALLQRLGRLTSEGL